MVQDIVIHPCNTRFRLKVYETPDGGYVTGTLPAYLNGKHFGPTLIRFILYQYYHCHVTQPLLLEQLYEFGIDISAGQLNNLLIEEKERFHQEKDRILSVGLEVSAYINVDDTGARHQGKNGYCTHIGNESFSWFESTGSKSRINFLKLMRAGHSDFAITMDAVCYMQSNKLPQKILDVINDNLGTVFANDTQWNGFLSQNGLVKDRHVQIATEGALLGSIIEHGLSKDLVIVSDDAGQFNVLLHALCWVHANRSIDKIIPFTDQAEKDLDAVKDQVWHLYEGLKTYKQNPNPSDKDRLNDRFGQIFTQTTASAALNLALKRIYNNKSELLLVLDRPDIPLHNNSAENAIREYVKRRKISGSTRSKTGRQCRDTFTSLKKTCHKLGVSFWRYLKDRIENTGFIPDLPDLVRQQALNPGYDSRILEQSRAFEILFGLPEYHQRKTFKDKIQAYCSLKKERKRWYSSERSKNKKEKELGTRHHMWADRFYTLRNHIIHGERIKDKEYLFFGQIHFDISLWFFLVSIKQMINEQLGETIFLDTIKLESGKFVYDRQLIRLAIIKALESNSNAIQL